MTSKLKRLALLFFIVLTTIQGHLLADVASSTGNIKFDINDNRRFEMTLSSNGLAIGDNLIAEANLHIAGNTIVQNTLTIGSTLHSSSNLSLSGLWAQSFSSVSSNSILGENSVVLATPTGGNLMLRLPEASSFDGRIYHIKKTAVNYHVNLFGGGKIDGQDVIRLSSGSLGSVKVISSSSNWHILSISGNSPVSLWTTSPGSNLIAWYDASDTSTILDTGGSVDKWEDKSGSGANLTASGTARPMSGTLINSLNALDFDGANDEMTTSFNPFGATINDASMFIIFDRDLAQDARESIISLNGRTSGSNQWELMTWSWDAPDAMIRFPTNDVLDAIRDVTDDTTTNPQLFNAYDFPSLNIKELRRYGELIEDSDPGGSYSTWASQGATTVDDQFYLGITREASSQHFNGRVAEIIILNTAIDLTTRRKYEGYLAHKWGLENFLSSSHPYFISPPLTD